MTESLAIGPLGRLLLQDITCTADAVSYAFQPASGLKYEIIALWATHDDTSSRTLTWNLSTAALTLPLTNSGSIAAGVLYPFVNPSGYASLYFIDYVNYLTLTVSALTAGKHMIIRALVRITNV